MMSGVGTRGDNTGIRVSVVSEDTGTSSNISNTIPSIYSRRSLPPQKQPSPSPLLLHPSTTTRPSSSFYSDSSTSPTPPRFLMVNREKKKYTSKIYDYNNCGYKLYDNDIECFLEPIKKELIKRTYTRSNIKIIGNTTTDTTTTTTTTTSSSSSFTNTGKNKVYLKNKDDVNEREGVVVLGGEEEEDDKDDLELLKDYHILDDFILNDIEFDMMHSIVREIENDELLNRSIWSPYSPSVDAGALACPEPLPDGDDEFDKDYVNDKGDYFNTSGNDDDFISIVKNGTNVIYKDGNNIKSFPFTSTGRPGERVGFICERNGKRKQNSTKKEKSTLNELKSKLVKVNLKVDANDCGTLYDRISSSGRSIIDRSGKGSAVASLNDECKKTKSTIKMENDIDHGTDYTLENLNRVGSSETLANVDCAGGICNCRYRPNTNSDCSDAIASYYSRRSAPPAPIPSSSSSLIPVSVLPTNDSNNSKPRNRLLTKNNTRVGSKELKRLNNNNDDDGGIMYDDCNLKRLKIKHSYVIGEDIRLQNSERIISTSSSKITKVSSTATSLVVSTADEVTSNAELAIDGEHENILLENQPAAIVPRLQLVETVGKQEPPESVEFFSNDSSFSASLTFYSALSSASSSSRIKSSLASSPPPPPQPPPRYSSSPSSSSLSSSPESSSVSTTSSTTFTSTSMDEERLGDNKVSYIHNDGTIPQSTLDTDNVLCLKRNNDFFNRLANNYVTNNIKKNNERAGQSGYGVVQPKNRWMSELNQILLVHFDEHMLPLTYDYLTLNNNNNEMDINLLKRENTAIEIDRLRKKISIVTHKPIVFVYTYGFRSLNRAKQVLESRSCMYNISPFFKDINEFISFLNQMILF